MDKKLIIDILGGEEKDKFTNNLMHSVDLFNENKKITKKYTMEIIGDPNTKNLCINIKNSFEKMGGYVLFVGIKNTNNYYIKENIKTITVKKQNKLVSFSFKNFIVSLGYNLKKENNKCNGK